MKKGNNVEGLPMKLTISRMSGAEPRIEVRVTDSQSSMEFLTLQVSFEDFSQALTGLAMVECVGDVAGLEKVGLKHEHKMLEFKLPEDEYLSGNKRNEVAVKAAKKECPEGWEPDLYFGSQGSFFTRDGEGWARCTIRRWVVLPESKE